MIKRLVRRILEAQGFAVYNARQPHIFSEDGLSTYHVHSFVDEPGFKAAYARSVQANAGRDHHMRWRAHVAYWVATQAARLPGDFVECGVSTGFLMSGQMQKLGWNALGKNAWLFDTWSGLDERFIDDNTPEKERLSAYKELDLDAVRANFAEFERVTFVPGPVPETLEQVTIGSVAYLSLDMNNTLPEIAALKHFWPKLVPGGFVLMDDYAYAGYEPQHHAFNAWAAGEGLEILSLPTGQGLLLKS
ncbi:MAG: TylF/MycF/NovP-related O-methyltransferase [Pseudomonadota bacterium]